MIKNERELKVFNEVQVLKKRYHKGLPNNHRGIVCLDMDGTIVDLYGQPFWLEDIQVENVRPFKKASPLVDIKYLNLVLNLLRLKGYGVCVITWLPPKASTLYQLEISRTKLEWLEKNKLPVDEVFFLTKGENKQQAILPYRDGKNCIMVDDDISVLENWEIGDTINANVDIIKNLATYLINKKWEA